MLEASCIGVAQPGAGGNARPERRAALEYLLHQAPGFPPSLKFIVQSRYKSYGSLMVIPQHPLGRWVRLPPFH